MYQEQMDDGQYAEAQQMQMQDMGDGQQELQLYDEQGNPQKFMDEEGNEIPFEEVQQYMMQQ